MRSRFHSELVLSILLFFALIQHATAAQNCEHYADQAVSSKVTEAAKVCSFTGPAWQASWQDHFKWCVAATQDDAASETSKRNTAAGHCLHCTKYAQEAVKAHDKNKTLKCGFTGDAWSADFDNHRKYCMAAASSKSEAVFAPGFQERDRNNELRKCEARAEQCRHYAQAAGNAALMNARFACDLTGPRFDARADHYGWCMANDVKARVFEANARDTAIQMCKAQYKEGHIIACQHYAITAVNQYKRTTALGSNCRLGGPRWHGSWDGHFTWCIRNFKGPNSARNAVIALNAENKARDDESRQCVIATRSPRTPSLTAISKGETSKSTSSGKNGSSSNAASASSPSSQRTSRSVRTNPSSRALAPGLLESDSNLVRSTPSATGTPIGGAGSAPPPRGGAAVLH
jgi:hypothetical protein